MTPLEIGLAALAGMGFFVMMGMFVPIALILMSFLGVWAIKGSPLLAAKMLGLAANDAIASYFFGVVPLFVLMGFLVSESGVGRDAFDVANTMFHRIKGGLGVGTVAANAIFAAVTGHEGLHAERNCCCKRENSTKHCRFHVFISSI